MGEQKKIDTGFALYWSKGMAGTAGAHLLQKSVEVKL